jgi:hypothetical protein
MPERDEPRIPEARTYLQFAASRPKKDWYRCSSCGFLAEALSKGMDREIPSIVRSVGVNPDTAQTPAAFCFVNAQRIADEITELQTAGAQDAVAFVRVVAKDRNCTGWYPYTPGADPLWHYEDFRMQLIEQNRRAVASLDRILTARIALMGFTLAAAQILVAIFIWQHWPHS